MEGIYTIAALWLGLAVFSAIIAHHLRISIALVEICIGVVAANIVSHYFGPDAFGSNLEWLRFLASTGAVMLTFLAGAKLDPKVTGFNKTEFGKGILGACFINDLGTVIALGLLFAPFNYKTIVFIGASIIILALFPVVTSFLTKVYGNKTAAIRAKWVMLVLVGLGALALWSGSEAVLPAYIAGMLLAEFATKEHQWVRRFRTLTVGFLTPFYFIRAGSLVSIAALTSTPIIFLALFIGKVISKIFGLYPVVGIFRKRQKEKWYYTLMMSTGLTFGTISALYGYSHGIVTQEQYSFLVAAVIASAVIPTLTANFASLPHHLLNQKKKVAKLMAEGIDEE